MLISVHLPKAAGSTFRKALEQHFGDELLPDYSDRPINTPAIQRNLRAAWACVLNARRGVGNVQCIHGHFLPLKYLSLRFRKSVQFVTWLRDPAERLVSHYDYCHRMYRVGNVTPFQRTIVEEKWSLERFCLCPEMRNLYSQFLWGVSLACFDFVGIVEHFDEDLQVFADRFLGASLPTFRENVNEAKRAGGYGIEPGLRQTIERHHRRDCALYRRALARRQARSGRA